MRRLLPVVTAALVLLVGCSDDDPEPRIAPTDSSSAASTTAPPPSPTGPVEPTLPAEAAGEDAAAAEAFVRFYWEMANYAQATGDVGGLRRLAAPSCAACVAAADFVEGVYRDGGRITGGEASTSGFESTKLGSASDFTVQVKVLLDNRAQTVDRAGAKDDERFPADRVRANFVLERASAGWVVSFWEAS